MCGVLPSPKDTKSRSKTKGKTSCSALLGERMHYLATFFTHSGAVKYRRYMRKLGIEAELLPVPRRLSSDCGIAAQFSTSQDPAGLITEDIHKLFVVEEGGERVLYSADG